MKNIFLILTLIIITFSAYGGTGAIPSGPDIKLLKNNMRFKDDNLRFMTGTDDPESVAQTADIGSIYINKTTGTMYQKQDSGSSTNWQKLLVGASGTGTDTCVSRWDGTGTALLQDSIFCITNLGVGTGLTSLDVSNLRLTGNTVSSTDTNGDIVLNPDGTGSVQLPDLSPSQPLKLDASSNIISSDIDLTADVTGVLPIANGGTNSSTALNNDRILVSSSGSIVEADALADGQLLIGTSGGSPSAANITGTADQVSVTDGAGTITLSTPQDIATTSTVQFGEVGVGAAVNAETVLDVTSTTKQSRPCPSMTTINRGSLTPVEGGCVYDTDTHKEYVYNGTSWVDATIENGDLDHGVLQGLSDDDHSQYALLAGRAGGQTLYGDTAASGSLTLGSTSDATKGNIYVGNESSGQIVLGGSGPLGVASSSNVVIQDTGGFPQLTFRDSSSTTANDFSMGIITGSINAYLSTIRSLSLSANSEIQLNSSTKNMVRMNPTNQSMAIGHSFTPDTTKLVMMKGKTSDSTAYTLHTVNQSSKHLFSLRNDGKITSRSGAILGNDEKASIYARWDAEDSTEPSVLGWSDSGGGEVYAVNTTTPLSKDSDYIVQFGAVNEYVVTEEISLDQRQRIANQTHLLKFLHYLSAGEMTITVLDQADNVISDPLIIASGDGVSSAELMFNVTSSVTGVKVKFEVTSYTAGMNFYIDDIILDDDAIETRDMVLRQTYYITQAQNALTNLTAEVEYNLSTATISDSGESIIQAVDDASNTRTKFVALKNSQVVISTSGLQTTAGNTCIIYQYNSAGTEIARIYGTAEDSGSGYIAAASGSFGMSSGDFLTVEFNQGLLSNASPWITNITAQADASTVSRSLERQQAHFVGKAWWGAGSGNWTGNSTDDLWHDFPSNTSHGTLTTYGDLTVSDANYLNVTIPNAKIGQYEVRINGVLYNPSLGNAEYSWSDGTTNYSAINTYLGDELFSEVSASIPNYSVGDLTLHFQYASTVTSKPRVLNDSTIKGRDVEISVYYYPPPEEKNVITTVLLPQSERNDFSAIVESDGTVTSEKGDFIQGDEALATNIFTGTFVSNLFTQPPACGCSGGVNGAAGTTDIGCMIDSVTTSGYRLVTVARSTGANTAYDHRIWCSRQGSDDRGERVYVGSVPRNQVQVMRFLAGGTLGISATSSTSYIATDVDAYTMLGEIVASANGSNQLAFKRGKYKIELNVMGYGNIGSIYCQLYNATTAAYFSNSEEIVTYSTITGITTVGTYRHIFDLSEDTLVEIHLKTINGSVADGMRIGNGFITKLND